MERILIIGSPGSGKTYLARHIAERLQLPLVHLDREYWRPGWRKPDGAAWQEQARALAARERWVLDGEYLDDDQAQLSRATLVVWLDLPRVLCLGRALKRVLANYRKERPDLAPGCPEYFNGDYVRFIRDILVYPERVGAAVSRKLRHLHSDQQVVILRSRQAVARFVAGLPSPQAA
jgi:adenylate kinase family enzyme